MWHIDLQRHGNIFNAWLLVQEVKLVATKFVPLVQKYLDSNFDLDYREIGRLPAKFWMNFSGNWGKILVKF